MDDVIKLLLDLKPLARNPATASVPPPALSGSLMIFRPSRLLLQGRPGRLDRWVCVGVGQAAVGLQFAGRRSDLVPDGDERTEQRYSLGLYAELSRVILALERLTSRTMSSHHRDGCTVLGLFALLPENSNPPQHFFSRHGPICHKNIGDFSLPVLNYITN